MVTYDSEYFRNGYLSAANLGSYTVYLGYHKSVSFSRYEARAAYLIQQGVVRHDDLVLIVGAGYNWLGEALSAYGCTIVATDSSPYIQATYSGSDVTEIYTRALGTDMPPIQVERFVRRYSTEEPIGFGEILNEDSLSEASRNRVAAHYVGYPDVLILEDVLDDNDMTEEEQAQLVQACKGYNAGITVRMYGSKHTIL